MIQGFKNIAADAALRKPEAYGPFLRMWKDAHEIMRPDKDEIERGTTPMRAIFRMEGDHEQPPGQAGSLAKAGEENTGAGLEIDKYEAVE